MNLDSTRVLAGSETLMRQASMTAHDYTLKAVHDLDEIFGKGFAKAHPELIGQYIMTSALDFGAAVIARAIETLADQVRDVGDQIEDIADQLNLIPAAMAHVGKEQKDDE